MPALDIRTVALIGVVLHVALGLVLLHTYLSRKTYPGFRCWTLGQIAWLAGFASFFLRYWHYGTLSIVLANPLFLLHALLVRQGFARFHTCDPGGRGMKINVGVAVVTLASCYWFHFVADDLNMRVASLSLGMAFILGSAAVEPLIWSLRGAARYSMQPVVSTALLLSALVMMVRAGAAVTGPAYGDVLAGDPTVSVLSLSSLFCLVIVVYGFIGLTQERMERELKDARACLEELANTDELTGLANRRKLAETARHDMRMAKRYGQPLSLIVFDLDHFKDVNDTHGHAVGDMVLAAVAGRCRVAMRDVDTLGRWGGEEFAVLMPQTGLEDACATAERLRRLLHGFTPLEGVSVTASFGVAELGGEDFESLAARADEALYRAKREGRDRVCQAAGEEHAAEVSGAALQ